MKISTDTKRTSQFNHGGKSKFIPLWFERKVKPIKTNDVSKPVSSTYTYSIRFNQNFFKWMFVLLFIYVLFSSCSVQIVIH